MFRAGSGALRALTTARANESLILAKGTPAVGIEASKRLCSSGEFEKHAIPERLQYIPTAEDPAFFEMVEYYFHRGCQVMHFCEA